MPLRQASRELAARSGTRQVEVVLRADRATDAVDRAVLRVWRDLLKLAKDGHWHQAQDQAHQLGRTLPTLIHFELAQELARLARWGRKVSVTNIRRSVPVSALRHLAARRGLVHLREAEGEPEITVSYTDFLAPFRAGLDLRSAPDSLGSLVAILFPPPSEQHVEQIVYASGWERRIGAGTGLAPADRIAQVLGYGLAAGQSQQEIAVRLQPIVQGVQSSARRVARTEALRVAATVQHETDQQLGDLVVGYQIHATLDQNTRPEHAARNGTIYYAHPKAGQPGYDQMPHPPQEADGSMAWNCLLPEAIVQGSFAGGSKARYAGKVLEVTTASGLSLRVTPNHPIFTPQGVVAAKRLHKGDNLIRYVGGINGLANDEHHAPSPIEEVFGAIVKLPGSVSFRPAVFEFHGDEVGVNGDIEVVLAKGVLPDDREAAFGQQLSYGRFVGAAGDEPIMPGQGSQFLSPPGVFLPSTASVRPGDLPAPGIGVHLRPFQGLCFGTAAQIDASLYEQPHETSGGILPSLVEVSTGHTRFVRELLERFAGEVALDEIVEIREFQFSGHVYDLQGVGGWIVANELFIHNCRCWLSPVLRDPGGLPDTVHPPGPDHQVYSDWWASADERRKRLAVGTRRYSAVEEFVKSPEWANFVDIEGHLLPTAVLQTETAAERKARVAAVNQVLAANRRRKEAVGRYGTAPAEPHPDHPIAGA